MKHLFILFFLLLYLPSLFSLEIIVPRTSNNEARDDYEIGLLKLILDKSSEPYTLKRSKRIYTQKRIIKSLKNNEKMSIYWMGTSKKLEEELHPIRVPLAYGILGYRVFIIHKNHQKLFDNIKNISDLQKLKGAQGLGWSDIKILEHSGLKQYPNAYENIFKMIDRGNRIDYFSRGVNEAFAEVKARKDKLKNLSVEKNILLVYPFSKFFFINNRNKELEKIINKGIKKAFKDGSYLRYFRNNEQIKIMFKEAKVKNRIRIDIPNPLLTPETKKALKKYQLPQ